MLKSFRPGKFWYDTEGKRIQAHGGSLLWANGKYYWYGENKDGVTGRALGEKCPIWHKGVRLYSSDDLYNWKDEGVIAVEHENEDDPYYTGRIMDRPHILYNEKTKKYVMWAKIAGLLRRSEGFESCYFSVSVSDDIKGPYTLVNRINDVCAGDFDLVKDDGKAYVIFELPHTEMICRELDEEYTGVGKYSSHLPQPYPPFAREAPAYFKRGNRRFLLTSGTTGYFPNHSEIAEIPAFHGDWIELGNACVGDTQNNSFHAQFSSVFQHPFVKDLYIALGDRWLLDMPPDMPNADEMFESFFNPEKYEQAKNYDLSKYTDENTSEATYVWLPIRFREDGTPYIVWMDEWTVEDFR